MNSAPVRLSYSKPRNLIFDALDLRNAIGMVETAQTRIAILDYGLIIENYGDGERRTLLPAYERR